MYSTALLVLDMQVGNFSEPDPIYNSAKLLSTIQSLISKMRSVQGKIVYIQNIGTEGDPDEPGTPGYDFHSTLLPNIGDVVVQKSTPDAFHETSLQHELESREIKKIIIGGLQTEYCVDTTCRRAFSLGYEVILVKDGHSTWDGSILTAQQIIDHHNDVLGGWFVTTKEEREIIFK